SEKHSNMDRHADEMVDLMALMLACDVTRFMNLQLAVEGSVATFGFLGQDVMGGDIGRHTWHDGLDHIVGHNDTDFVHIEAYWKLDRWVSSVVAKLADRLDALGVLDDTAIIWMHNMGNGAKHDNRCAPAVIVGGLGGTLRTNRHVRFNNADRDLPKRMVNDLHRTILNLVGVETERFGEAEYNRGPISEIMG
ncbi:MAG: DUF1552 domain-containing protein, partial [Myxococcota bacterium]